MKRFYGRLFKREETDRVIELDDDDNDTTACDEYVHQFVNMGVGDVSFVEVSASEGGPWVLWRCEGILSIATGIVLYSKMVTPYEAQRELAAQVDARS